MQTISKHIYIYTYIQNIRIVRQAIIQNTHTFTWVHIYIYTYIHTE